MRSAEGAIESIEINDGKVTLQTINNTPATGICGSGVLDILAKFYTAGIIDKSAKFNNQHPNIRVNDDEVREFLLAKGKSETSRDIVITQLDIRAIQLAKSAIQTGIQTLLDEAGISVDAVDQIIIAGGFGSYISLNSAKKIGMLPNISAEHFSQVGNAAGIGAKVALISYNHRIQAQTIAQNSRYLELSGSADFNSKYINNLNLPEE